MIFLGFSFSFVDAMGAFPTGKESPFDTSTGNYTNVTEQLSSKVTGLGHMSFSEVWLVGIGATTVIGVAALLIAGVTNMIGIYIFGTFFWGSWFQVINIFGTFDFLESGAGLILLTMITVGMTFMFIGAVIGMLSGSNQLR